MRIQMLRTLYPHWGAHSGINQVVKYFDPETYRVHTRLVSDSDADFPFKNPKMRAGLRRFVQSRGMQWYQLSDLTAEAWVLGRWLAGEVDIVHYLDGEHSAQYLPRLCGLPRFLRPKMIGMYHQPADLLDSLIDKSAIRYLDAIIVMAPEQATYFERLVDPERIHVILHGIDTDFFRPVETRNRSEVFRCITVGNYLRDYQAVRAVAEQFGDRADIEFHVVSSNAAAVVGLRNVVIHRGIDDDQLRRLYQQSDVLFLPLQQATANNALLEGIACGLPVVSTLLPSVKTYVPGEEALLFERNDPQELAAALLRLAENPDLRYRMAQAARWRACELDWRCIAPQYTRIYDQLIHRSRVALGEPSDARR